MSGLVSIDEITLIAGRFIADVIVCIASFLFSFEDAIDANEDPSFRRSMIAVRFSEQDLRAVTLCPPSLNINASSLSDIPGCGVASSSQ